MFVSHDATVTVKYCQNTIPLNDMLKLKRIGNKIAHAIGTNILDIAEFQFTPYGITICFILCTSHLAIHTYPEHNFAYFNISSCNEDAWDVEAVEKLIGELFGSEDVETEVREIKL